MNKIGIASDHAGYEMKEFLVGYLDAMGYEVLDFGTHSPDSVDYADFAHPLAEAIENGELERGIALCGSGEGMTMTLNKHQGIRAGLAWEPEIASLIRRHNNANIIVFPARFISNDEAVAMLDAYFSAQFEGGRTASKRWRSPAAQPEKRQNKGQNLRARPFRTAGNLPVSYGITGVLLPPIPTVGCCIFYAIPTAV